MQNCFTVNDQTESNLRKKVGHDTIIHHWAFHLLGEAVPMGTG